ncbi:hypothetical protein IQ238_15370 [Pleurocapsales cyanobacterium LEGE 06147]|nr:hypothetical protein [Pleurocapsales cyanobacterium LEGE 06147]
MRFPLLSLSLFSLSAVLPLVPSVTPSANACAIVDATTQVAIHGSPNPAQQKNNVTMGHDDNCFNNNIVNTTTQLGISPGEVQQTHQGDYFVGGGNLNNTGFTTPVIQVPVGTQVDVYSPAHDPQFLKSLLPQ